LAGDLDPNGAQVFGDGRRGDVECRRDGLRRGTAGVEVVLLGCSVETIGSTASRSATAADCGVSRTDCGAEPASAGTVADRERRGERAAWTVTRGFDGDAAVDAVCRGS
jgi:hypothetical protein